MVDEGRSGGGYGGARPWEDRSGRAAGTILATAIAAGVIAFLLRRSREEDRASQPRGQVRPRLGRLGRHGSRPRLS